MADYQLTQTGPQVQEAINIALSVEAQLAEETAARIAGDASKATTAALQAEIDRATAAEAALAPASSVTAETARATAAEDAIRGLISDINDLIPEAATESNQLADKAFVNSSIASQTSTLITDNGQPFSSLADLQAVTTASPNDYAYVVVTTSGGVYYDRYKYNGSEWVLEFRVNSTVFTAAQWAAVNSGITTELVTKLTGLPDTMTAITNSEIDTICV